MEQELRAFDKQLEQEAEEEQKKNEKAILALNARKEALLKEKKSKVKQEMEKMSNQGASKEDQEAILKEHSKDLAKLMNKMDADRMRMQSSLEERLKKKREAKRQNKVDELKNRNEEEKREFEEKVQSERDRVQAEEVIALKETIHVDNLVAATIESEVAPPPVPQARVMPDSYRLAAPLSEGELASLLLSSPLYQKIEGIKSLLSGGAGKGGQFSAPGKDDGCKANDSLAGTIKQSWHGNTFGIGSLKLMGIQRAKGRYCSLRLVSRHTSLESVSKSGDNRTFPCALF